MDTNMKNNCFQTVWFRHVGCLGILVLDDPTFGGFRVPKRKTKGDAARYPLWGTIPKLWTPRPIPEDDLWYQFPILTQVRWRWMMRKRVFKRKRFSNEVFGLLFSTQVGNAWEHDVIWNSWYPWFCSVAVAQWWHRDGKAETRFLSIKLHQAEGKQLWFGQGMDYFSFTTHRRKSFEFSMHWCGWLSCISLDLNWICSGNLVVWVQIIVVVNDRLAYSYFGVQH